MSVQRRDEWGEGFASVRFGLASRPQIVNVKIAIPQIFTPPADRSRMLSSPNIHPHRTRIVLPPALNRKRALGVFSQSVLQGQVVSLAACFAGLTAAHRLAERREGAAAILPETYNN